MKHRWYDSDPTLSLSISLLKNSSAKIKHICAEAIIKIAKENNIKLPNNFFSKFSISFKRWYDEDKELMQAMEYLKLSTDELRKKIALELIELLQHIDNE
jgi:hypothetical protein